MVIANNGTLSRIHSDYALRFRPWPPQPFLVLKNGTDVQIGFGPFQGSLRNVVQFRFGDKLLRGFWAVGQFVEQECFGMIPWAFGGLWSEDVICGEVARSFPGKSGGLTFMSTNSVFQCRGFWSQVGFHHREYPSPINGGVEGCAQHYSAETGESNAPPSSVDGWAVAFVEVADHEHGALVFSCEAGKRCEGSSQGVVFVGVHSG